MNGDVASESVDVPAGHPADVLPITREEYDALVDQERMSHEQIVEALSRVGMSPLEFAAIHEQHNATTLLRILKDDLRTAVPIGRAARRAAQRKARHQK